MLDPRTGNSAALKQSGVYPKEFCDEIAGLYKAHKDIAA